MDKLYELLREDAKLDFTILYAVAGFSNATGSICDCLLSKMINFENKCEAIKTIKEMMDFEGFKYFLNDEIGREKIKTNKDLYDTDLKNVHYSLMPITSISKRLSNDYEKRIEKGVREDIKVLFDTVKGDITNLEIDEVNTLDETVTITLPYSVVLEDDYYGLLGY